MKVISPNLNALLNAVWPIYVNVAGKLIFVNLVAPLNALIPIYVSLLGKITVVKTLGDEPKFKKAWFPIVTTELGNSTYEQFLHWIKALVSIVEIWESISNLIEVTKVELEPNIDVFNNVSPLIPVTTILLTFVGIIIFPKGPEYPVITPNELIIHGDADVVSKVSFVDAWKYAICKSLHILSINIIL